MKKNKNKPRTPAAGRPMLQFKTTFDFGEAGIPLERLGEITKLLKERHLGRDAPKVEPVFVPVPFDRYVDLHAESNPSVDSGIRPPAQAGRGRAQGRCALCLWSARLGDWIGRRRRLLYLYYWRGVAR